MRIFAAGVGHVVRRRPRFLDSRNDLTPDRVIRIVCRQQVKKVWGNGQREFVAGQQNAAAFLGAQFQMFLELREGGNSVFELPFPIVPEFRSRVWPIPRRVRNEVFSVPILRGKSVHFLWWTKKLRPLNIVSMQALGRALRT